MIEQRLCLKCGLCCNGVIFADVHLEPGDDPERLREVGLPLCGGRQSGRMGAAGPSNRKGHGMGVKGAALRFTQPCAALDGCTCRIYAERPTYCRQFECLLLKQVKSRNISSAAAVGIIRAAQDLAEKARRLLRALGNLEETVSLNARFRRTTAAVESADRDKSTAAVYGDLTLVMHDLNCLLSEKFYPGGIR